MEKEKINLLLCKKILSQLGLETEISYQEGFNELFDILEDARMLIFEKTNLNTDLHTPEGRKNDEKIRNFLALNQREIKETVFKLFDNNDYINESYNEWLKRGINRAIVNTDSQSLDEAIKKSSNRHYSEKTPDISNNMWYKLFDAVSKHIPLYMLEQAANKKKDGIYVGERYKLNYLLRIGFDRYELNNIAGADDDPELINLAKNDRSVIVKDLSTDEDGYTCIYLTF